MFCDEGFGVVEHVLFIAGGGVLSWILNTTLHTHTHTHTRIFVMKLDDNIKIFLHKTPQIRVPTNLNGNALWL
jgi:hypothetical protein